MASARLQAWTSAAWTPGCTPTSSTCSTARARHLPHAVERSTDACLCAAAGVDKRSVDTWMHPNIFHMQYSTGAPPDYFDPNGQNWGFPTYNWEEMAKDNYEWWRRRLTTLSQCASLLSPLRCLPEGLKSGYKWYLSSPRVKIQRYLGCQSCFL